MLQVPSGVVADRWSRRQILAWAQLVRGVGFGVWLIYPHFWGFLAGLPLWGVKTAFTSGTFEALLYDELKAEGRAQDYTRIFGRTRAIQSGGVLLAALGAALAARFGYGATLIASLVSVALSFAAALSLPRAPRASGGRRAELPGAPAARPGRGVPRACGAEHPGVLRHRAGAGRGAGGVLADLRRQGRTVPADDRGVRRRPERSRCW